MTLCRSLSRLCLLVSVLAFRLVVVAGGDVLFAFVFVGVVAGAVPFAFVAYVLGRGG